jgi:hypothetical protein
MNDDPEARASSLSSLSYNTLPVVPSYPPQSSQTENTNNDNNNHGKYNKRNSSFFSQLISYIPLPLSSSQQQLHDQPQNLSLSTTHPLATPHQTQNTNKQAHSLQLQTLKLKNDMLALMNQQETADVLILLRDGESIRGHRY